MNKTYYTCAKIRKSIDLVLEENAKDVANTIEAGISKDDKDALIERCYVRLLAVETKDPKFVASLLSELDFSDGDYEEE